MFWGGDVSRTRLCTTLALRISQSGLEDLWVQPVWNWN